MIEQSLNGTWQMRERGTEEWLPGAVPGGVHLDLMAAGRIPDPFVGDEELRVAWVADRDWEYRLDFVAEAGLAAEECLGLVFDGLDTLAEVRLNGELLGSANSMFRAWRWEITGMIKPGPNELAVVFRSAVREGAELDAIRHLASPNGQLAGAPYLRKAPCHFGWDWGPKLPNIGFWQGVRMEGWSIGRLADVRLSQRLEGGRGEIAAEVHFDRAPGRSAELGAFMRVEHPDGRVDLVRSVVPAERSVAVLTIDIADPELWWPNGLGGQPLYGIDVELACGDRTLDVRRYQVGLRTLELRREPDRWGESFTFVVNGVPIFAKGSSWIPADSFPARVTAAQLGALLGAAADANHNMIRTWGGGYYETETFYDLCDRHGILVWQDFMFACSVYPLTDPAFRANVESEVREQVRRLRHRPCLALWCGNNEMERGWTDWGWSRPGNDDLREAYLRFFSETLPAWVAAEDPATPYWPSSPSSGRPLEEPIGVGRGDEHEWVVWHGLAPFSAYGRETYRFVSEFGFESLPALATVAAFAPDPDDWNLGSPLLDHHQRCPAGNARILYYMAQQFRLPRDFDGLIYLSQVLQAEAMRVGVEHWRRERARCGGTLFWQLNDCWPVSSWSSIDYFGRWKALHYATRRFYSPVLLSCSVAGDGASGKAGNDVTATFFVTNDLPRAWRGEIRWSLERLDGGVVATGTMPAEAPGLATTSVCSVNVPSSIDDMRSQVLVAEMLETGSSRALVVTPFVADKHLALRPPRIEALVEPEGAPVAAGAVVAPGAVAAAGPDRAIVRLRSEALARWVELSLDGADVVFSDNYFDLPARRRTEVSFALPPGWSIDRARHALRVRSVVDTYVQVEQPR